MMYSTTFRQHSLGSRTLEAMADAIARGVVQLQALFNLGRTTAAPTDARAKLIELADSYEASQPSYAADLRAAANRS